MKIMLAWLEKDQERFFLQSRQPQTKEDSESFPLLSLCRLC